MYANFKYFILFSLLLYVTVLGLVEILYFFSQESIVLSDEVDNDPLKIFHLDMIYSNSNKKERSIGESGTVL